MEELDYDALTIASKTLTVSFIILIVALNLLLMVMVGRKPRFFRSPKSLLLISVAVGDVFMALFSLVVNARFVFEEASIPCRTRITAKYYQDFVISFAYGLGLIVLALELIIRHKRKRVLSSKVQLMEAFIFSFIPWFFVLIFVLPLTMARFNWEQCKRNATESRILAMYWMCIIVPAIVAVLACFAIMFIKLTPIPGGRHTLVESVKSNTNEEHESSMHHFQTSQNQPPSQEELNGTVNADHFHYSKSLDNYPTPPADYPTQEEPHVFVSTSQPPISSTTPLTNPVKEKCVLLCVAITHFLCVLPYAVYYVTDVSVTYFMAVVLNHSFFWLLNFRSIITAIIWIIAVYK